MSEVFWVIGKKPDERIKERWLLTYSAIEGNTEFLGSGTVALVEDFRQAKKFYDPKEARDYIEQHGLGKDYCTYELLDG